MGENFDSISTTLIDEVMYVFKIGKGAKEKFPRKSSAVHGLRCRTSCNTNKGKQRRR
jgi:hypothetical protein